MEKPLDPFDFPPCKQVRLEREVSKMKLSRAVAMLSLATMTFAADPYATGNATVSGFGPTLKVTKTP